MLSLAQNELSAGGRSQKISQLVRPFRQLSRVHSYPETQPPSPVLPLLHPSPFKRSNCHTIVYQVCFPAPPRCCALRTGASSSREHSEPPFLFLHNRLVLRRVSSHPSHSLRQSYAIPPLPLLIELSHRPTALNKSPRQSLKIQVKMLLHNSSPNSGSSQNRGL